jgi:RNase P subunit RPR2
MTHIYTILDGATVRAPIDLDTHEIDWLRVEPCDDPLILTAQPKTRRFNVRRVLMRCTNCGHTKMQVQRGTCHKCREGIMTHEEGRVKIMIREAK